MVVLIAQSVIAAERQLSQLEKNFLAAVERKISLLTQTTKDAAGNSISVISTPEQVYKQVQEIEFKLMKFPKDSLVHNEAVLGDFYIQAFKMLVAGRGQKTRGDGSGWYLNNKKGPTGLEEALKILKSNPFDRFTLESVRAWVESFEPGQFNVPGIFEKKPKHFISNEQRRVLLEAITLSQEKVARYTDFYKYRIVRKADFETLLLALGRTADINPQAMQVVQSYQKHIAPLVVKNYHDESVKIHNNKKGKYRNNISRLNELHRILDTFERSEKNNVALVAKTGVDTRGFLQMLSDGFVNETFLNNADKSPIVMELSPISLAMQGQIGSLRNVLDKMGEFTGRKIIIYFDMSDMIDKYSQAALKPIFEQTRGFMDKHVQFIFGVTPEKSRVLFGNQEFASVLKEIQLNELDKERAFEMLKKEKIPFWYDNHAHGESYFKGIADDSVLEFAWKNGHLENPDVTKAKAASELMEAAIVRQLRINNINGETQDLILEIEHMRDYLKTTLDFELIPGHPSFETALNERMEEVDKLFKGDAGYKYQMEKIIRRHFTRLNEKKMTALVELGPPGTGKSYGPKVYSQVLFDNEPLILPGAEYKNPTFGMTKLIGSGPGYVGQNDSVLADYIANNPRGGFIVIEEADNLHQDIIDFWTNTITEGGFRDAAGNWHDTSNFILKYNSNKGQDWMLSAGMTWDDYAIKVNQLYDVKFVNGKQFMIPKKEATDEMFEAFFSKIYMQSNPGGDTSEMADEIEKQKRRYQVLFKRTPNKEELKAAAEFHLDRYISKLASEYEINLSLKAGVVDKIIDIENFNFAQGYSYIEQKLESVLFENVNEYLHKRGSKITVDLKQVTNVDPKKNKNTLLLKIDRENIKLDLGNMMTPSENQWANSAVFRENIKNLPKRMNRTLKASSTEITNVHQMLKRKLADWNTKMVMSLLGTSGNGKTEFGYTLAESLFNDRKAAFKISGLNSTADLNNFFRSNVGYAGSTEETQFEKWFKARRRAGGGVIMLDELLSFYGLNQVEVSQKVAIINELYDMLDEGVIRFGSKKYDARGFFFLVTGNMFQEAFAGVPNNPDGELEVQKLLKKINGNEDAIMSEFAKYGIDAPKVARLGGTKNIIVRGPLPKSSTHNIGGIMLNKSVNEIVENSGIRVKVTVDDKVLYEVVDMLTSITLGMRGVGAGIEKVILDPIGGIIADIPELKSIEVKMLKNGEVAWYADGKRIVYVGEKLDEDLYQRSWELKSEAPKKAEDFTPQLKDIKPKKKQMTRAMKETTRIHEVEGHWMVDFLLTGENTAQSINLIPGDWYLGYMMPKERELIDVHSLTTEFKEVLVLEAGHRSVFERGTFEYGGGSSGRPRDPKGPRSDDLGRVDDIYNRFLSNNIFEDYSEFSNGQEIDRFKKTLRMVGKYSTDYVLRYGNDAGISDGINNEFTKKINAGKEEFLNEKEIEAFVKKIKAKGNLKDPNKLFMESVVYGVEQFMKRADFKDDTTAKAMLLKELVKNIAKELETNGAKFNPTQIVESSELVRKLFVEQNRTQIGFKQSGDCNSMFKL
jgi:ATP-dependent Clp protease ATP-binding subunit ClpA